MAEPAPERPLPAWSLPAGSAESLALPTEWPGRVTREWAWGESTGEGRARLHPRQRDRGRPSRCRRARGRCRRRGRRGRRDLGRRGRRGRPLRPRDRLCGDRPLDRKGLRALQRPRPRRRVHRQRDGAPRRPSLGRRAGLRRDQHEPVDDEEPVRRTASRGRRPRILPPDGARRLGAQHARRELPVALLVRDLGGQPRGAGRPDLLLQPEPTGGVLRARRRRRDRLARRGQGPLDREQLCDAAHDRDLRADPRQAPGADAVPAEERALPHREQRGGSR